MTGNDALVSVAIYVVEKILRASLMNLGVFIPTFIDTPFTTFNRIPLFRLLSGLSNIF